MNLIKKIENILLNAGIEEYKKEAQIIVTEISGLKLEQLLLDENIPNEQQIINTAKKRASTKAPIQHILGYSYFMGEKYIVNSDVLIPRDETEILVNCAYELIKNKKDKINILDIGTGTGCVSCALAKKLKDYEIEILSVDISSSALITAIENINNLNLEKKVVVRKSNLYSKIRDIEKFDLIVSNPPYIPISEKNNLQYEVKNFEPETALFAFDEQGVEFYKKIISDAFKYLKKDGYVIFELGINQKNIVENLLNNNFTNIGFERDLANIERVIWGKLK